MALTQKGELWVLEQVIQHTDYNFIKVKLLGKTEAVYQYDIKFFFLVTCIYKMPLIVHLRDFI